MNKGTKIRTIALIIVLLNQANVNLGVLEFGNEYVNIAYKIFSYLLTLAAAVAAWWYNNDFSEVSNYYTGCMRQAKDEMKEGYVGERFFTNEDGTLLERDILEEDQDEQ